MFHPQLAIGKPPDWTDEKYLKYIESQLPLIVQPKLDGIRCLINEDQKARSRTLKPIPNKWIRQQILNLQLPYGLDGELTTHSIKGRNDFNRCSSDIMSQLGTPEFTYTLFDWYGGENYEKRLARLRALELNYPCEVIASARVNKIEDVLVQLKKWLNRGYEGIILKKPDGIYKEGRSTLNEFLVAKLVPWDTAEGVVIGYEELKVNCNPIETDNLGHTKRAKYSSNMLGGNKLGALIIRDKKNFPLEAFNVGTGFTMEDREKLWLEGDNLLGKVVTYKYKANRSMKDKPNNPVFKGFRDEGDT